MRIFKPKLISTYLRKMLKQLKPNDKIQLWATTSEPWNAILPKMKKTYQKILLCPGSEYGSTFLTWRTGVLNKLNVDPLMDFSALSRVTKYFGTQQIINNIDHVVNLKRRVRLAIEPLRTEELLEGLLMGPPPNFPMDNSVCSVMVLFR